MNLLKYLDENRVVSFTLSRDFREVEILEECDQYYRARMNKDEFGRLIGELQEIHKRMVDDDSDS